MSRRMLCLFLLTITAGVVASVSTAAPPSCVTLPGSVPGSAGAHARNPQLCPPPPPPATTYTLRTTDVQSADPVWKTSYSVNSTYELYFALDVIGAIVGTSFLQLEIVMPSGLPYQVFVDSFTASSGEPIDGGIRIWKSIPVAGTMIQQFSIYGEWSATAYVQEPDASMHTASTSFTLDP